MGYVVRAERSGDRTAVRAVHVAAFGGRSAEADLVDALRDSPGYVAALSLAAEIDGAVVGHVLLSELTVEREAGPLTLLVLAPLGVRPERQREGVGSALVRAAIREAGRLGYPGIVLVGHPAYYRRFGFISARRIALRIALDVPEDAFMVLPLSIEALLDGGGEVRLPPAFAGV
ncbi:MAG: N-acetyltransferase [Chthonomonadales bacterium]|nr:N-acetyltransferase [Chthonomonadales bacterium]